MEQNIRVTVNGIEQQSSVEPRMLLVQYLREARNLTGTHVGCDTGQCGACTVLLNGQPVKSCMVLAVQADGGAGADGRRLKAERAISPDSGRLLGEARLAMRLLHARHDDGGGGAASAQRRIPPKTKFANNSKAISAAAPATRISSPPYAKPPSRCAVDRPSPQALERPDNKTEGNRMAVSRLFGATVKRREDPRLITGKGMYTDDFKLPGMLHMAILRSPYAHARITRLDVSKAQQMPGVHAVITGKDLAGKVNPIPSAWLIPASDLKTPPYHALAIDHVRFTGDGVAAVIAEDACHRPRRARPDRRQLRAAARRDRDREGAGRWRATTPRRSAWQSAFHWTFANGDRRWRIQQRRDGRFANASCSSGSSPTRWRRAARWPSWQPGADEMTLYNTTQNPHIARFLLAGDRSASPRTRCVSSPVMSAAASAARYRSIPAMRSRSAPRSATGRPVKWVEDSQRELSWPRSTGATRSTMWSWPPSATAR